MARVLLVDDSDITRAVVARILQRAGHETVLASDGAQGALMAIQNRPDIVVSDLEMPMLDGCQLARMLKSDPATRHLPVVILTSHQEARSRYWSLKTGVDAYVIKESDPEELIATVNRLLNGSGPVTIEPIADHPEDPMGVLVRVVKALDASLLEATLSNAILADAGGAESLEHAVRAVLGTLAQVVDAEALGVAFADKCEVTCLASLPRPLAPPAGWLLASALADRLGPHRDEDVTLTLLGSEVADGSALSLDALVALPLPSREASAILGIVPRSPRDYARLTAPLVEKVVPHVALALDNARLADRLREMSARDGLTRLLNHRTIFERLGEEVDRAARYGGSLAVALADIDHFKRVNDAHGHTVGDTVLRVVAAALRTNLRTCDALGRYGGEEFLAVLPSTDVAGAVRVAERMRRLLSRARVPGGGSIGRIRVTASFGVACLGELPVGSRVEQLIDLADRRLYLAKHRGRNRVVADDD
jgi:two-component system, cell cycle response regulator